MDFVGGGGHPWESQFEDDVVGIGSGSGSRSGSGSTSIIEREHLFDKVVTPSDVGKLNRLVIPKQFAEKYFPLDSSTNEKGLLLNFEDRNGKPWRFRYSYWNSSQSYVMTKGWSRFVKEKKLDAGDIVSFQRGVGELGKECLYIDWRRRPDVPDPSSMLPHHHHHNHLFHRSAVPWSPLLLRPPPLPGSTSVYNNPYYRNTSYNSGGSPYGYINSGGSVYYMRPHPQQQQIGMVQVQGQGGVEVEPMVYDSVPVVHGKAAAKRLRLFGVNMECPISESDMVVPSQPSQVSPHLQLRLYNGTPVVPSSMSMSMQQPGFLDKGKSSMSLDLDM